MENIDNMAERSLEALSRDNLTDESKKRLRRELICGAAAAVCMAAGLIYSMVFPARTTIPAMIYTVGFLIEATPIFIASVKGIISKNMTNAMELLVAIAIIACYFSGELILSILIPLILNIAHFLEERSIMGGRDVIDGLRRMQQSTATLIDGDSEIIVETDSLSIGQHIVVRPGDGIPIDGVIISGEGHIDQKSLTGEPLPFHAKAGDSVYAGTINIDGCLVIEVKKEFVDTSFSQILALLEKSETISAPESRIIDKFMAYYIPFVLAVSAAVALLTRSPDKAIAILVVSCPCGQMLVSSAPMIAALSAATRRGILIKNSKFIEEMTELDTVVFDKTGTITRGELSLTEICPANGFTEDELISAAAGIASASNHPVSRALTAAARQRETESANYGNASAAAHGNSYKPTQVKEISGLGVEGVTADGSVIRFGKREWIAGTDELPESPDGHIGSISYVEAGGRCLGYLVFGDTLRDGAAECITELAAVGIDTSVMLTGDRHAPAEAICAAVGIGTLHADLLPEDKYRHLRELKREHRVLAVGDGINDAPALREADVGIAMGAMGSDLAIMSSDIALMNNDLKNIPYAARLAKKTRRTIYQNLALSIGISACMIGLSAFGVISALAGSILHNCGAFAVLINSSRILRTK